MQQKDNRCVHRTGFAIEYVYALDARRPVVSDWHRRGVDTVPKANDEANRRQKLADRIKHIP